MKFEDFAKELTNKRRTVADLSRFISTRTDHNPNYTLLLGAGCSVSSGVRSAYSLADIWRKELYEAFSAEVANPNATADEQREFLKGNQGNWYDTSREYSSLFEKRYDLQRQRRMFVETEVATKTPSIGYAYLTALVEQNFFNTIFTTNFDDLLNEAFYLYSDQRPIVCAHDSSINSVTVTSKRPKIIKLHGDYLFDDLKSTVRETETLEQNMKAKFAEFSKDYGLIVVGYSGGDRSIMDVLSALLKNEEYLKNGVYWCIRKGSDISEELRKLMWRDRVYFVEIDGFDELFADFYCKFNNGEVLPANALTISRRPSEIADKLLASDKAFPPSSDVLRKARERLERQTKRTTLVSLIVNPDSEDSTKALANSDLGDDDLIVLMEIQNLIASEQYRQAIEKARETLRAELKTSMKLRLLRLIIKAHQGLGDTREALSVAEELIRLQPKEPLHYLRKASILRKRAERLECIETAIRIDPYSVDAYLDKAELLSGSAKQEYGQKKQDTISSAREALERGLELDPHWRNPCWREKFDLLLQEVDRNAAKVEQEKIIETLEKQNPFTLRVLMMRQSMLSDKDKPALFEELLGDIEEAQERAGPDKAIQFEAVKLDVLAGLDDAEKLEKALMSARTNVQQAAPSLALTVASILRRKFGRDDEAITVLLESLNNDFDVDVLDALVDAYADLNQNLAARGIFEKWQRKVPGSYKKQIACRLHELHGDYEESLKELRRYEDETGIRDETHVIYINLRAKKYQETERLARLVLERINYSPEAVVETVNLEFARKMQGKKADNDRLTAAMKFDQNPRTSAAVFAVLERKNEMLEQIRKAIRVNKTFRFEAADWPVFDAYRDDPEFLRAISKE